MLFRRAARKPTVAHRCVAAACGLAISLLLSPDAAEALSITVALGSPQPTKTATVQSVPHEFEMDGTLDLLIEVGANPLDTTLMITGGRLTLTDMDFDFGGGNALWTRGFVGLITTSLLTAAAFDGGSTYFFDLGGSLFSIDEGQAIVFNSGVPDVFNMSRNQVDLQFIDGTMASLTVTGNSVGLEIPMEVVGTPLGPVTISEFSGRFQASATVVPEPSTFLLVVSGLCLLARRP